MRGIWGIIIHQKKMKCSHIVISILLEKFCLDTQELNLQAVVFYSM